MKFNQTVQTETYSRWQQVVPNEGQRPAYTIALYSYHPGNQPGKYIKVDPFYNVYFHGDLISEDMDTIGQAIEFATKHDDKYGDDDERD